MFRTPRRAVALALTCLFCLAGPLGAQAQTWPGKPVKVVVNFPPGGAADQLARAIALPLQESLGQPVVVENRGGSGGNVGGDAVKNRVTVKEADLQVAGVHGHAAGERALAVQPCEPHAAER